MPMLTAVEQAVVLQCEKQVHAETVQAGLALKHPLALGILHHAAQAYRLEASMLFPQVTLLSDQY